jgi:hypothetical protein
MNFPNLQEFLDRLNARAPGGDSISGNPMAQLKSHMPDMQNPLAPPPAVQAMMPDLQNPFSPPKGVPGLGGSK